MNDPQGRERSPSVDQAMKMKSSRDKEAANYPTGRVRAYVEKTGLTNPSFNSILSQNIRSLTHLESGGLSRRVNKEVKSPRSFYKTSHKRDERLICTYSTDVNQNASHALCGDPGL